MIDDSRRNSQIPNFLIKLLRMLEDKQCSEYIRWIQSNDGFQIFNVPNFNEEVLSKYFKHKNFSSFVRQLNLYGFSKVRGLQNQNIYRNPNFRKGSRASLRKIERKSFNEQQKISPKTRSQKIQVQQNSQQDKLLQMKQKHQKLQQRIKSALTSNREVLSENSKTLKLIDTKNPHEQQLLENLFNIFAIAPQKKSSRKTRQSSQLKYFFNPNFNFQNSGQESATKNQSNLESEYINLSQFKQLQNQGHQFQNL